MMRQKFEIKTTTNTMYSLFFVLLLFIGIHFSYKYLEKRIGFVPNVIESQSKARYNEIVGELSTKTKKTKKTPNEDDVKRKQELDSFLEELKHNPSSESNVEAIPKT